MTYVADRLWNLGMDLYTRAEVSDDPQWTVFNDFEVRYREKTLENAKVLAKVERGVLVAILDELQMQLGALPHTTDNKYARDAVVETWRLVRDRQRYPAECLIGLDANRSNDALRCLQKARLERDCVEGVEFAVRCAAAALCMPKDPLVLWDYMLEQLWRAANEAIGGEKGMAKRLLVAMTKVFEEAL